MFGNQKNKNNPADFFRDESYPRPPPRFAYVPTPLDQESPKPSVPDVSLIMKSPLTALTKSANSSDLQESTPLSTGQFRKASILKGKGNFREAPIDFSSPVFKVQEIVKVRRSLVSSSVQTEPLTTSNYMRHSQISSSVQTEPLLLSLPPQPSADSALIQELITLVKGQSVAIEKMQEQLNQLLEAKDQSNSNSKSRRSSGSSELEGSRKQSPDSLPKKLINAPSQAHAEKEIKRSSRLSIDNTAYDVSKCFKNLRLPQIDEDENTMFSQTSAAIKPLDMPDFDEFDENDDGNTSFHENRNSKRGSDIPYVAKGLSPYESSDDGGSEHGSAEKTRKNYQRRVLENVNHYEENGGDSETSPSAGHQLNRNRFVENIVQSESPNLEIRRISRPRSESPNLEIRRISRPRSNPSPGSNENRRGSDTTVYGLSAKHLSFSTKQYLQRHGLVQSHSGESSSPSPLLRRFLDNNGDFPHI